MAKLTSDELIEAFKELTLIELSEFVKKFEERFQVAAAELGLGPNVLIGPGAGDQHAGAAGLGMRDGEVAYSLGTSGVVLTPSPDPVFDDSGDVNGVSNVTGGYLPLVCTLNATKVTDTVARLLGVGLSGLTDPGEPQQLARGEALAEQTALLGRGSRGVQHQKRPLGAGAASSTPGFATIVSSRTSSAVNSGSRSASARNRGSPVIW